jgi:antibiotic biosynthesis monooxygenase (ABM) superfamily enzyme
VSTTAAETLGTTIVTQTTPAPERMEEFAAWQRETSEAVAGFPGFIRQAVLPPNPPTQEDWVILQHFADRPSAVAWLRSDARARRVAAVQPLVSGRDDVHLITSNGQDEVPSPVSAVISTRVVPGQEAAYRAWETRIVAAQARAPGFQGYRLEPPIPELQEDWLAIVTFASEAHLQAWLASPERAALLAEAEPFTEEFHTRIARTGFDYWFGSAGPGVVATAAPAPAWKQNMVVLLMLYPVVFLFGYFVQVPWLQQRGGLPFPVALFVGNLASVLLLNLLVPWASQRFGWWLQPATAHAGRTNVSGALILAALYAVMILLFTLAF